MPELTPEQRLAADAIDAAEMISRSAGEVAIALQEAARALRLALEPRFAAVDHAGPTGDATGFWVADQGFASQHGSPISARPATAEEIAAYTASCPQAAVEAPNPPERPIDVERSDAGFTSGPIWVGGLGQYEPPGVYWSVVDRGITHAMLMDACEGLSDDERREAHVRVKERALDALFFPSVRDLIDALAWVRQHKAEAAAPFDIAADVDWAPEDASEALDAPKSAEPPTPVAESNGASSASPAVPECDLNSAYGAELDMIAYEFGVTRSPGETDASLLLRAGEELASDVVEAEALARVAPALHRSPDLGGAWRGVSGSQAVDAGRFHAVDESAPILD
jgi:hypothetical protein